MKPATSFSFDDLINHRIFYPNKLEKLSILSSTSQIEKKNCNKFE